MEDNLLILVDKYDNEIGYCEKMEAHREGLLHRAFSIFVFDWEDFSMLLQKRASGKYHSGGLWSNACCSHPRKGETMEEAINQRLKEELGYDYSECRIKDPVECGLLLHGPEIIYSCGDFQYKADFGDLSENEIDHVFLYSPDHFGHSKKRFTPNPEEISEIKWINIIELKEWMEKEPTAFTAWFKQAFDLAYEVICIQARHRDMFQGFLKH